MARKKTAAERLDDAAAALYRAGKKVGGEKGGRVGNAVANVTIGPIRNCFETDCTRCARGVCDGD